jgi:hypothetical protein
MDSTTADLLIFGSSTANHHYYPPLFEKKLNISVYNTGRDGNTIFYNYAVLQSVLKRYIPKIAILDFNAGEFQKKQENYDRLSSLLPYYQTHPYLDTVIQLRGSYEKFKLLSKTYPFNSLMFSIAIGNTEYNRSREYINDQEGFVPLNNVWNKKIDSVKVSRQELDSNEIKVLQNFITACIKSKIKLYIFVSPRFIKYDIKDPSIKISQAIAEMYSIPFFDYSNDPFFWAHPELFADKFHLNATGAKIYSNTVINDIKSNEQQKIISNN